MATNDAKFQAYNYIRLNGVNTKLIEQLLAGLETPLPQGVKLALAGKEGAPEYLPLSEAAEFVMSWFIEVEQVGERDQTTLRKLISSKSFPVFARTLKLKLDTEIKDSLKLQTASRLEAQKAWEKAKSEAKVPPTILSQQKQILDNYSQNYYKLREIAGSYSPNLLRGFLLKGISYKIVDIKEQQLVDFLTKNLTRLAAVERTGTNSVTQDNSVAKEIETLIRKDAPELNDLLNFIYDPEVARRNSAFVKTVAAQFMQEGGNLDEFERQQVASAHALSEALPTHSELLTAIKAALPNLQEKDAFAEALLKEIVSSSSKSLTAKEIVTLAAQKIGSVDDNYIDQITETLRANGIAASIEYRQNEMVLLVNNQPLPGNIKSLIKEGINPFLAHESAAGFASLEAKLLADYNTKTNQVFPSLQAAYEHEAGSASPDRSLLRHFRHYFDERDYYRQLSSNDKSLVDRVVTKKHQVLLDRWIDLEDTLSGRKTLRKLSDNWEAFTDKITIPGTHIPLFKISNFISAQIDIWKAKSTTYVLARTANSTNPLFQFIHWGAEEYQLGGYTRNGAAAHMYFSLWSKGAKWATAGVVRDGVILSARTGTRLLLKLGGKTLARAGAKAIVALGLAATAIGGVVAAIFTALMVFDLVKLGWDLIKNFIVNNEFRNTVLAWGAGIWATLTTISLASLFAPFTIMFTVAFQGLLIALGIAGGIVFFIPQIQNNIKNTIHLDPGTAFGIISSLICNEGGEGNACADKAVCLAKYLNECYGSSVTSSDFGGGTNSLQCVLAKGIDAAAGNQIYYSAIGYTNLQCVGFAQAVQTLCGRSLPGKNACNYVEGAAGYTFISGLAGVQPGDPVIIGSSNCSDGSPGHIAIFLQDAGALITVADANEVCPGCVKGDNKLPVSEIAGYLKKQ